MEGGGEGMVAVVRGTDRSMTVTLLSDGGASTRNCGNEAKKLTRVCQSSVETNTERNAGSAQPNCDVRYASGHRFSDYQAPYASSTFFQPISSMFRGQDPFTQSLRKYPEEDSSAEIIQRIIKINYARSENCTRKRYQRSLRSLIRRSKSQTQAADANTDQGQQSCDEDKNLLSSMEPDDLSQDELVSYTYDYLKNCTFVPQTTDVRYFTEVIRGRLKGMLDEKPMMCPWIRSRYSRHRHHYHKKNIKAPSVMVSKEGERRCAAVAVPPRRSTLRHTASSHVTSCQPGCKPCYCGRLPPCHYDEKVNMYEQLQDLSPPELNPADELPPRDMFNKPQHQVLDYTAVGHDINIKNETFENEINKWLKTVPINPNLSEKDKVRREKLVNQLAKKLKILQNQINFPSLARKEIMQFLGALPMRFADNPSNLRDSLTDDLIKRLNVLAETNFKRAISDEVKSLPFEDTDLNDNTIQEIINTFIEKLTPIALNRSSNDVDYKKKIRQEIINIINNLPLAEDTNSDQVLELVDKFVERLHSHYIFKLESKNNLVDVKTDEIEDIILDWCRNTPEISRYNKNLYSDLVKLLVRMFLPYTIKDVKDNDGLIKLKEDVKDRLYKFAIRMNTTINPDRKNVLSSDIIKRVLGIDHISPNEKPFNEDESDKILRCIREWLENIPEISVRNNNEIQKGIKTLAFQLNEIYSRDDDIENILADMKEIISKWLKNVMLNGIQLDSKTQDNVVNDLIQKIIEVPSSENKRSEDKVLQKEVMAWLQEIPYVKLSKNSEQNVIENFIVRIKDLEVSNSQEALKSKIEKEIINFIENLSGYAEKHITPEDTEKLKLKIYTELNLPQRRKLWDKKNNLRNTIFEEITNIVNTSPILKKQIKESLKYKLTDIILNNTKDNTVGINQTFDNIINILKQETRLNKNDMEIFTKQIIRKVIDVIRPHNMMEQIDLQYENKTFDTDSSRSPINVTKYTGNDVDIENQVHLKSNHNLNETNNNKPQIEEVSKFKLTSQDYFQKQIDDKFTNTIQNNQTPSDSKVKDEFNKKIDRNIRKNDIGKEKNNNHISVLKNIENAAKVFDKKIEERKANNKSQTKSTNDLEHTDRSVQAGLTIAPNNERSFLEKQFSTSTPLSSTIKYPSVLSVEPSINLNKNFSSKMKQEESLQLSQYLSNVKNIINNWLKYFPININDKQKYDLIDDIANDVLDRQKYLQLSGIGTNEKDELEHLKYQVFKRIHNFDNQDVIDDIIINVDCLNHRLLSLETPRLTHPVQENKPHEIANTDVESTNNNEVVHKIATWLNTFVPTLNNGNYNEQAIQILARNIESLKTNNNCDSSHIKNEILQWLTNIYNNIYGENLNELAENLKILLCDTNSIDTVIPVQDTSEFVVENLSGAILEWFKTTEHRQKLENQIQDYYAFKLANDIKQVFAQSVSNEEINNLLIQEIIKDLAKVTGDLSNKAFHYIIACDLIKYLKELKLFHDISDRDTINDIETNDKQDLQLKDQIKEAVINWSYNLPLQEGVTIRHIEDTLNKLIEQILKYNLDDISEIESVLRDQIVKLLSKIPLKIDNQGYKDKKLQAASLIAKLKDIFGHKQPELTKVTKDTALQVNMNHVESPSEVYKQLLHDTISKTFFEKLTVEEQISFNLLKEKLAEAFIDLHYSTDDVELRSEFKNKLYKEINRFCDDYLRHRLVSPLYSDKLQDDLHKVLKNVSLPTIRTKTNDIQDNLKNEIDKWVCVLPFDKLNGNINEIQERNSALAKRLYPLINKSKLNIYDYDEIKQEIVKWLQKLPLKAEEIINTEQIATKLLQNIKILTNSIQRNGSADLSTKSNLESKITSRKDAETQYLSQSPPTSLSLEEIEHLKRIRTRSDIRAKVESLERKISNKSTIKEYTDVEIQTNIFDKDQKSVQTSKTSIAENYSLHREISPQVIIREYYWDSNGSRQSFRIEPSGIKPQKIIPEKTKATSKVVQTERNVNEETPRFEVQKGPRVPSTKDIETQTRDESRQSVYNKKRSIVQPQPTEEINEELSAPKDLKFQQNKVNSTRKTPSKRKEYEDNRSNKTYEGEIMNRIESLDERMSKSVKPTVISEELSPILITEKRSERRFYASPEYITRQNKGDKICCSCKNHLLTKCRNRPHFGCRQTTVKNNFKHCSRCFGGCCPHPSNFFFNKYC